MVCLFLAFLTSFPVVIFPSLPLPAAEVTDHMKIRTSVKIDSVRELYQTAIGAHPEQCGFFELDHAESLTGDQVTRGDLPETLRQMRELVEDWRTLGLTPSSYTPGTITGSRTDNSL